MTSDILLALPMDQRMLMLKLMSAVVEYRRRQREFYDALTALSDRMGEGKKEEK